MTKRNLKKNSKIKALSCCLGILSLVLGVLFLFQYSSYVSADYERGEKEQEVEKLAEVNEELGMNFLKTSQIGDIETIAQEYNFEKTSKVHYIRILTTAVAAVK